GPRFRGLARHLAGVDLSPEMLARARARGCYDELHVSDIVSAMEASPEPIDLLTAGDVFVYIGDLEPVLRAASRALRPGGLFAFSTERLEATTGPGFKLLSTARYAHRPEYVRELADRFGLSVRFEQTAAGRHEHGEP